MDISFFIEKLSNLVVQEAALFGEVEGQVRLLRNELEWMRLVLEDADADARRSHDKRLKIWLNQIRDAAYDAEDVIDDFMFKVEHQRKQRRNNLKFLQFLPACVSLADKLSFIHELDARIREINFTIEKILTNKSRYNIESPSLSEACTSSQEVVVRRENWLRIEDYEAVELDIVGRKGDTEAVTKMIIGGDKRRKVVAIVGMGGLGKTVLAKKVLYQVRLQFNCAALVCVSHKYIIRDLLIRIANGVMVDLNTEKEKEIRNMEEDQLAREVFTYLRDKRYLIVLDDVWSPQVWDALKRYFPESDGSRVLITTRDKAIASHAYSTLHPLQPLGETESWELFQKRTFQFESNTEVCPEELEDLGRDFTKKCKGWPLLIEAVGEFLSRKEKTRSVWSKLLENMERQLRQGVDLKSCYKNLHLSYIYGLPHSLKFCFLYFGTFPKDLEIKAKKLIQLWIAEGLVQPTGEETMEETAEWYLEVLIQKNMIYAAKIRSNGKAKSYLIHDIFHDLAVSIARDSKFFEVIRNTNFTSPMGARRLIVYDQKETAQHLPSLRLRSLICSLDFREVSLKSFLGAKLLTVLDLTMTGYHRMKELSEEVGQLIHLKYLSIRGANLVRFPWSIGRLVKLQILDLQTSTILSIPCSIWKLHQLRYLHSGYSWLSNQPMMQRCLSDHLGVDQLTNLQTLHLRPDAWLESSSLKKLTQLRKMNLYEGVIKSSYKLSSPSLVKLKLEHCKLEQDLMLTRDKLPKLRALCDYFGRLPQLECLKLVGLHELEEFKVEEGAMPVLKTLQIDDCPKMKELLHGLLPQLEFLKLVGLRELEEFKVAEGAMPVLKTLQITECPNMKKLLHGLLPQLECLKLVGLRELEEFKVEEGAMPVLKTLQIAECPKMKELLHGLLPQLEFLKLVGLRELEEFKVAEGAMSVLKTLQIAECPNMKRLLHGLLPQLECLKLVGLRELEELKMEEGAMPVLKTLQIAECPKMKELLHGLLPQLEFLELVGLHELEEFKVAEGAMPVLKTLQIAECPNMKRLLHGLLPQLECLKLVGLRELEELKVEEGAMPVLKTLQIAECPKMKELLHGLLPQLEFLELVGLHELEEFKVAEGAMPVLKTLQIAECPNMKRLLHGLLPQLEFLKLVGLHELEELKVEEGAMPVLKTLQIAECPKMKRLLHGLLHLKNLQKLKLEGMASELIEEIETTDGEEFEKIRRMLRQSDH